MTLLRVDASIRTDGSHSRELADVVEQEWRQTHPGDAVERRQLGVDVLPADAWGHAVAGSYVAAADRSPEQSTAVALAAELVDELLAADAVLLAVPLYNFGVSQHIKTYFDLIMTDRRALSGPSPVVLVTVRGGAYGAGTPRAGWDHSTPYLCRVLADVWGADLTVVEREFTLVGVNPALDEFAGLAAVGHVEALDAAHAAGGRLAGTLVTAGR